MKDTANISTCIQYIHLYPHISTYIQKYPHISTFIHIEAMYVLLLDLRCQRQKSESIDFECCKWHRSCAWACAFVTFIQVVSNIFTFILVYPHISTFIQIYPHISNISTHIQGGVQPYPLVVNPSHFWRSINKKCGRCRTRVLFELNRIFYSLLTVLLLVWPTIGCKRSKIPPNLKYYPNKLSV